MTQTNVLNATRSLLSLVLFSATCALPFETLAVEPNQPATRDQIGAWSDDIDWGFLPIHAILTPEKKILSYGQGAVEYGLWDPSLGIGVDSRLKLPNDTATDIFCSSSILIPDSGDVMITGGDISGLGNDGNQNTTFFDRASEYLYPGNQDLKFSRWYPTTTTLPHGEILAQGGAIKDPGQYVTTPEIFDPASGWRTLNGIDSDYTYSQFGWWYPRSWVAPNGLLFNISKTKMYYIDYRADGQLVGVDTFFEDNTHESSTAVMFRPGEILQVGGGPEGVGYGKISTTRASVIDINNLVPEHRQVASMNLSRHWDDATVLPNGKVLVTGGSDLSNVLEGDGPAFTPEIWDPDTDTWELMDAENHARLYHSISILLPDATVLTAGGGSPGPVNNKNAQIFYPPYLYDGDLPAVRPAIASSESQVQYGQEIILTATSDHVIEKISLIKTGSVTHSFNNEQRYMELGFVEVNNTLVVTLPDSPFDAPPGFYLLFAVDDQGTPSEAEMLHFAPDPNLDLSVLPQINDDDFDGRCDYSLADKHNGYGWNALKKTSCNPLVCVDNDGDGWGWNGLFSCLMPIDLPPPTESDYDNVPCIDKDGNGWGWQQPFGKPSYGRSCKI